MQDADGHLELYGYGNVYIIMKRQIGTDAKKAAEAVAAYMRSL